MFLGIEIGGTKLQMGLGPGDGRLAALCRWKVAVAEGAEGIRRQILSGLPDLLRTAGIGRDALRGVGVGFGGPVDDATRGVLKSHQVGGWEGFPLAEWAEAQVGVPAAVGNDADVAGLAEARFGAGRGLSPVFYVTVGSGIGGALILDGEIYRGCGRGAGEIGHLWVEHAVDADDPEGWRILEHCASGWAIARAAGTPGAEAVAEAARRGDGAALRVLSAARRRLALALTHVLALLSPRRIIIGGGVALMGEELFFAPLRAEVARRAFAPFAGCYDVVPAALGEAVVVHGALALAARLTAPPSSR